MSAGQVVHDTAAAVRQQGSTRIAWAIMGVGVALQIAYPLTDGVVRSRLTVAIVAVMGTAAVVATAARYGPLRSLVALGATAGLGLAAEVVGTATGYPFGGYEYTGGLGPSMASVPLIVGLAWTMGALPAYAAAARLAAGRSLLSTAVVTALGLAAWDVFLDPQMVADGRWAWDQPHPHLPGVPDVPLTNFAGWLLVAAIVGAAVAALLRTAGPATSPGSAIAPAEAQFLWVYVSSILAHAVFLGLPGSAAWGALAMGVVAVPLALRIARAAR
ncbi:MAG: carotenoid biosynthesis protein [Pseudonocardiales bacterium]|nr:carotenoid biosynthesis protein [Pseudonocardiales bacterium]